MLIAEELFLLLVNDVTGRPNPDEHPLDTALAGAVVIELAQRSRLDIAATHGDTGPAVVVVRDPSPTGNALLDSALRRSPGRKPLPCVHVLQRLTEQMHRAVMVQLRDRGIVREEVRRALGMPVSTGFLTVDPAPEAAVRERLCDALLRERIPQAREVALIALLDAIDEVAPVVPIGTDISIAELGLRSARITAADRLVHLISQTVELLLRDDDEEDEDEGPILPTPFRSDPPRHRGVTPAEGAQDLTAL